MTVFAAITGSTLLRIDYRLQSADHCSIHHLYQCCYTSDWKSVRGLPPLHLAVQATESHTPVRRNSNQLKASLSKELYPLQNCTALKSYPPIRESMTCKFRIFLFLWLICSWLWLLKCDHIRCAGFGIFRINSCLFPEIMLLDNSFLWKESPAFNSFTRCLCSSCFQLLILIFKIKVIVWILVCKCWYASILVGDLINFGIIVVTYF